jgi:hypothetical protein
MICFFSDSDFFKILAVKGENISISSNQREAHLNIVNPCAVCFFERPIMRGETLCFSVEPIVRDGKVAPKFSFKVGITEIHPEEFLPVKPYLYDITSLRHVSRFEKSFKKVQGEIAFQYTTEGVASIQYKANKSILQNITFEKSYLLIELYKVKLSAKVPDVTASGQSDSVYAKSKNQLDLIRREVEDTISIYSKEIIESLNENLGSGIVETDSECDKFKQNDLHQAVEGIYKRLQSIEEHMCISNTGRKNASLQQTISSLESDIKEIKGMLKGLSGKPVQISPTRPISEVDERSVYDVIQPNFTEFVQLLDTVPFIDRMFQKSHLTLEEYRRIRISSQTNPAEANRDLSMIIFRRQSIDLTIFKQCLIETKQDGVLGKLFPKK